MAEQQERPQNTSAPLATGGGSGPVGAVGGMSAAERVHYIQELQKTSPLNRISDAVKKLSDGAFGLSRNLFDQAATLYKGMQAKYTELEQKDKRFGLNQHIAGLTENVRGKERLIREADPQVNVDLPDGRDQEKKRGLFVESDWTPKNKGQIE